VAVVVAVFVGLVVGVDDLVGVDVLIRVKVIVGVDVPDKVGVSVGLDGFSGPHAGSWRHRKRIVNQVPYFISASRYHHNLHASIFHTYHITFQPRIQSICPLLHAFLHLTLPASHPTIQMH
jgi:hypothetical protein